MTERYFLKPAFLKTALFYLFRLTLLITLLFYSCLPVAAQEGQLSPSAKISVITCGPFQKELYSAFGHSAIRVHDPESDFDAAYNYGVFDFDQPNFYLNFARGYLYYKLGVYDYKSFEHHYIYDNRYVHEQVLNLTQRQKQKLFDFLQNNAKPGNEYYRYDYFYNNCATKMRDVVQEALGNEVSFDGSYIKTNYTIRDLTDIYLKHQPWGDLGIDICLGLPMDKVAAPIEYMFLPDYVEAGFDHAFLNTKDGKIPLVEKKNIIYEEREQDVASGLLHPLFVFIPFALIAIVLTIRDLKKRHLSQWFDVVLFGITGMIGVLLFVLWFFTDHQAASRNLNIIWALPLHLAAVMAFIKNPAWLKNYFGGIMILSLLLLLLWPFLPQDLHYALIPIVVAQAARAYSQYRIRAMYSLEKLNKTETVNING